MENKIKTAEEIVSALAEQGEPFYEDALEGDELVCTLCGGMHGDRSLVKVLDEQDGDENGMSLLEHTAACAWRMAVEYVTAKQKVAKKGKRK